MSGASRQNPSRASRQKLTRESTQNGDPSTVAGTVGALPLVEHAPYRPDRTLPLRVELVRQLRRRRTQVAFALVALLPVILWVAFELGDDGPPGGAPNLVDLAKGSGANFAVFALFASASFLLVVVVALFFGDTVARRPRGPACATCSPRPSPALGCCGRRPSSPACCRRPRCCCSRWCRYWSGRWRTGRTTWSARPVSR